ncbi:MAG: DRTGG domain-containing protein [Candidatus Walczuchella monophlebidarum]
MKYIVGAMQLSHYLLRIDEDCLVITSGYRSYLIFASLLANSSSTYVVPVVGIILTEGLLEEESVIIRLIKGFPNYIPIMSVSSGTFETIKKVANIKPRIYPNTTIHIQRSINIFYKYASSPLLSSRRK